MLDERNRKQKIEYGCFEITSVFVLKIPSFNYMIFIKVRISDSIPLNEINFIVIAVVFKFINQSYLLHLRKTYVPFNSNEYAIRPIWFEKIFSVIQNLTDHALYCINKKLVTTFFIQYSPSKPDKTQMMAMKLSLLYVIVILDHYLNLEMQFSCKFGHFDGIVDITFFNWALRINPPAKNSFLVQQLRIVSGTTSYKHFERATQIKTSLLKFVIILRHFSFANPCKEFSFCDRNYRIHTKQNL